MTYSALFEQFRVAGFDDWVDQLEVQQHNWLVHHGDYARWSKALSHLPAIENIQAHFDRPAITIDGKCKQNQQLLDALKGLSPWRKGPFQIAEVFVDTEWRSDFKWDRVLPYLTSLQGRKVLDIGCGNGYHCWRMLAEQPALVVGVEPSVLFNLQFRALQHYLRQPQVQLLPFGIEDLPNEMNWFDTVFSMGVLYHRKSPIEHLLTLKSLLAPGGELCLETLVIEGEAGQILLPEDRYARMRNVWFIPSALELKGWLERCGFYNVRIVDCSITTIEEQRSTEWMPFESLAECLDSNDPSLTLEGLPAPRRAVLLADKP